VMQRVEYFIGNTIPLSCRTTRQRLTFLEANVITDEFMVIQRGKPSDCMELSPAGDAANCTSAHDIPNILWLKGSSAGPCPKPDHNTLS
jgi:hypothetical protein